MKEMIQKNKERQADLLGICYVRGHYIGIYL